MSKSKGYDFYLGRCLLPIAPEKLQVKINSANRTLTLINEGEVNLLKTPALTDVEFECRIPQIRYPFAVYPMGFKEAAYFLDYFERLKTDKKPFQFIVSRALPDGKVLFSTNMKVSMEDYGITEQAKEGFDLQVKIKLKQYRAYSTKTVSIKGMQDGQVTAEESKTREEEQSPAPETSQRYVVVKGDCLWSIAKKFYGDGTKYMAIYEANREVVGGNPNKIYPGQELVIPSAAVAASVNAKRQRTAEKANGFTRGAASVRISQVSML